MHFCVFWPKKCIVSAFLTKKCWSTFWALFGQNALTVHFLIKSVRKKMDKSLFSDFASARIDWRWFERVESRRVPLRKIGPLSQFCSKRAANFASEILVTWGVVWPVSALSLKLDATVANHRFAPAPLRRRITVRPKLRWSGSGYGSQPSTVDSYVPPRVSPAPRACWLEARQ